MTRAFHIRAASLLLVLGFSLAISADAYGLHGCPHHHEGSPPPTSGPSTLAVDDAGDAGGHHGEEEAGPCTCIGSCHGAAATPLPAALPAAVADHGADRSVGPDVADSDPRARTSLYLLPLANAPPTLD